MTRAIDLLPNHERAALLRAATDLQELVREFGELYGRYNALASRMHRSFPTINAMRVEPIRFDQQAFLSLKPIDIADEFAQELLGQVAEERREVEL